jgi:hypothetical protein
MSSDDRAFVLFVCGMAGLVVFTIVSLAWITAKRPSQMEICINAKYEWRGGDCVEAATDAQ